MGKWIDCDRREGGRIKCGGRGRREKSDAIDRAQKEERKLHSFVSCYQRT